MTVSNVDYAKLAADTTGLKERFATATKTAIAFSVGLGTSSQDVAVALAAGSVGITAGVTPPAGASTGDIQNKLSSPSSLGDDVAQSVSKVQGIDAASTGTITCTVDTVGGQPLVLVAPAPAPAVDCNPICADAQKSWDDAAKVEKARVAAEKVSAVQQIKTTLENLKTKQKLDIDAMGEQMDQSITISMEPMILAAGDQLRARAGTMGDQVVHAQQLRFQASQAHTQNWTDSVMRDMVTAGYDATKAQVDDKLANTSVGIKARAAAVEGVYQNSSRAWESAHAMSHASAVEGWASYYNTSQYLSSSFHTIAQSVNDVNMARKSQVGSGQLVRWSDQVARIAADLSEDTRAEADNAAQDVFVAERRLSYAKMLIENNGDLIDKLNQQVEDLGKSTDAATTNANAKAAVASM